ncbi:luciferin 4-monooxygenase-like [Anopheles albimanus]|uniref:luciferin 4-monooxygenase-like n=1 Tax=Anopheles albimanus TaxID=7167 RepID=UPI00163E864D|nr:luciferin 4-monooxygenase-like [Anopheles albimanus]
MQMMLMVDWPSVTSVPLTTMDAGATSERFVVYGGDLRNSIEDGCRSLGELVIKRLYHNGTDVALVDGVTGQRCTYHEILERSLKLANRFHRLGLKRGSVVAIASENSLHFPIVTFATIMLGGTILPLNPSYTVGEMAHVLQLTKPWSIFASSKPLATIQTMRDRLPFVKLLVALVGQRSECPPGAKLPTLDEFFDRSPLHSLTSFTPQPVRLKEQVAVMVMSSGTTGLPKAVQLTHHNVMTVMAYQAEDPRYTELPVPIRVLGLLPFYHVFGFMLSLNSCLNRVPMVVLPHYEPHLFLRTIQEHRITMVSLVPPLMVFLAKHPAVAEYDLSSLHAVLSGAAPLSKEIEDLVRARLPNARTVRTGYGMSETSLGVISRVNDKVGSVGKVHKTTYVKVLDLDTGEPLGPGRPGEICVKGPLVMKGYLHNEQATREMLDADGWLHTGDIGYYDEEQDFFIVDRLKDLIKYKGFQVPPAELEDVLLSHPKVRDAAVVGLPDEAAGELPAAFVVLQPDTEPITEAQLAQYVASKLSPHKWLRGGVYFVPEIPKTGSGKILRRQLRQTLQKQKAKL